MSVLPKEPETYEVSPLDEFEKDSSENEELPINNFQFVTEKKIDKGEVYILHITATFETSCKIVVATSKNECKIYHLGENQLAKIETISDNSITGVQFNSENSDLFYCGSRENIKLWDLRSPQKSVLEFSETKKDDKALTCFEVSPNNRLITAGTELHNGEAFMLFWDVRNVNLMGGYWDTHADTITQVRFDKNDQNKLMSGSVDGLINMFDLKHTAEEDALLDTFNTESSIEELVWFNKKGKDCIGCITHTSDIQLWSTDGTEPYAHFRRLDVTKAMKRKSEAHCYVVSAHRKLTDGLLVLAGGSSKSKEYLKCLSAKKELECLGTLVESNQRVRSSFFNLYHNILVTGGESGLLNVWNIDVK